jgi:hypothetical protein
MDDQSSNSPDNIPEVYFGCVKFHFLREMNPGAFISIPLEYVEHLDKAVKLCVDKPRGGLQARCINAIRKGAPDLYNLARDHRQFVWNQRKKEGTAVAWEVGNIPPDASYREIQMALKVSWLPCHMEFLPRRNNTSSVEVYVNRIDATHLLSGDFKPSINSNVLSLVAL